MGASRNTFMEMQHLPSECEDDFAFDDKIYKKTEEIVLINKSEESADDFTFNAEIFRSTEEIELTIADESIVSFDRKEKKIKKTKHLKEENCLKPYACKECEYRSTTAACLNIHIDTKHRGIYHHCHNCNAKLSTKGALKQHVE